MFQEYKTLLIQRSFGAVKWDFGYYLYIRLNIEWQKIILADIHWLNALSSIYNIFENNSRNTLCFAIVKGKYNGHYLLSYLFREHSVRQFQRVEGNGYYSLLYLRFLALSLCQFERVSVQTLFTFVSTLPGPLCLSVWKGKCNDYYSLLYLRFMTHSVC